jgi:hypothetical protein
MFSESGSSESIISLTHCFPCQPPSATNYLVYLDMPAYAPAHSHYNAHAVNVVPHRDHGSSESALTDDSDESEFPGPATSTSMQGRDHQVHHRLIKLEKVCTEELTVHR